MRAALRPERAWLASCGGGAWAELVAVPTSQLAVLPSTVTDAEGATLPTAGLTALRALDLAEAQLSKRVLVTGATGGVGESRAARPRPRAASFHTVEHRRWPAKRRSRAQLARNGIAEAG